MKTKTSFEKFKGEISINVKIEGFTTLIISEDDAQELLLQLGETLMKTRGHVQTGRHTTGKVPKKFIMGRK